MFIFTVMKLVILQHKALFENEEYQPPFNWTTRSHKFLDSALVT